MEVGGEMSVDGCRGVYSQRVARILFIVPGIYDIATEENSIPKNNV